MTATLAHICRHPIKGHGREELGSVLLSAGACLPFDRHWAVAHEAAKLTGGWVPCANFARGAKAPTLMAITSTLDEATRTVTLRHPDRPDLTFRPDDTADLPAFLDWIAPLAPPDRAQPARIVSVGRGHDRQRLSLGRDPVPRLAARPVGADGARAVDPPLARQPLARRAGALGGMGLDRPDPPHRRGRTQDRGTHHPLPGDLGRSARRA